jgi:hypothetical protein
MSGQFTVFPKEVVDKQFEEAIKVCSKELHHTEIKERFHKALHNRFMPALIYDENTPEMTLYRVTNLYDGFDINNEQAYSYPPNPKMGRANIEGEPVLYCSLDPMTAIAEMKGSIPLGKPFYISKWKLRFKSEVMTHQIIFNSETEKEGHFLEVLTKTQKSQLEKMVTGIPEEAAEGFVYAIKKMGDLFTNPNNDLYHITSAYSHDIMNAVVQDKEVPIIVYPSVESDQTSINWAMHPKFVDSEHIFLTEVVELMLTDNSIKEDGKIQFKLIRKGQNNKGVICNWQEERLDITHVDYTNLVVYTKKGVHYRGEDALHIIVGSNDISLRSWLDNLLVSFDFKNFLFSVDPTGDQLTLITEEEIDYEDKVLLINETGLPVTTPNGADEIIRMAIPMKWRKYYS